MSILRGECIHEVALLTATRELYFIEKDPSHSFIEEECRQAFQKGKEKGEKIGYEQILNDSRVLLELLQALIKKLMEQNKRLLEHLKPQVVEFAIAVCERIIRKELSQPEAMVNLINSLLNVSASRLYGTPLNIILAPDDLVMLESHFAKIQYDKHEITGTSFRADPFLKRGDCRIETPTGLLNYTISRELADLQTKILQA